MHAVGTHQARGRDWITGVAKKLPVSSLDSKVSLHTERDWESIIDRFTQLLLAPDIALCRLHRCMAKEKLNLFEFPSHIMAEAGATTAVMPHAALPPDLHPSLSSGRR
jgi:hypothetical protein